MEEKTCVIAGSPALCCGAPSERAYLFLHGKDGSKEEARAFAQVVCPKGYWVVGIDLPGHGARRGEAEELTPWAAVPEVRRVLDWLRLRCRWIGLRANSIGAWLAMLACPEKLASRCLFVSPILDMEALIEQMMRAASVSEAQLRRAGRIPTDFGETLSWEYLAYVRDHPILSWTPRTHILWADGDGMTGRETVERFAAAHACDVTVMSGGEHWFHTAEQMAFLRAWEDAATD